MTRRGMRGMRGIGIGCLLAGQALGLAAPEWSAEAAGAAAAGQPAAAQAKAARSGPLVVTGVTLGIRHRVFEKFADERTVRPNEKFQVGDTDYSAQVVRFVPDFSMNLKTRKIVTRSPEPNNPAFQIIVREKNVPQDTTWAFLNSPPHFARKSMLAFLILRIDFKNHEPVVRPESPAAAPPATPASPAGKK